MAGDAGCPMGLLRDDLLSVRRRRPFDQMVELETAVLRAFGFLVADPSRAESAFSSSSVSAWFTYNKGLHQYRVDRHDPRSSAPLRGGSAEALLRENDSRFFELRDVSDVRALALVEHQVDEVVPVEPTTAGRDEEIFSVMAVAWSELTATLVRARNRSAAVRAAGVAESYISDGLDPLAKGSCQCAIALAHIWTGGLQEADELLFSADVQGCGDSLAYQLVLSALLIATGERLAAVQLTAQALTRADRAGLHDLDAAAGRIIEIADKR